MELIVRVLGGHNSAAQSDAFLVVGAIAIALGAEFNVYFPAVAPHLINALKNSDEYEICQVAAELISFITEAIGDAFFPVCSEVITLLLTNLANSQLNSEVKPPSIVALGDIALAIGERFELFADPICLVLDDASQSLRVPVDADEDMIELVNQLRSAIIEAYSGIVNGLGRNSATNVFIKKGKLEGMLRFLVQIAHHLSVPDTQVDENVLKGAAGLLGDLQRTVGPDAHLTQALPYLSIIFEKALQCPDERVQDTGRWARSLFM